MRLASVGPAGLRGPLRPALLQTLEFAFRPDRFCERYVRRFGRTFAMRGMVGAFVMTAEPEHARRVFAADSDVFDTLGATSLAGVLGKSSVLATSGATHRRQRKLLTPPLHGPRLRAFGAAMHELAREHIAKLVPGQAFLAHDLTTAFTLDVIVRTVFGAREGAETEELRRVLGTMLEEFTPLAIFTPALQTPYFPPWKKYLEGRQRFDELVRRITTERRRTGEDRGDVLSLLLASRYDDGAPMDEEEIHDQLLSLLMAGHETTAIALAWLLHFVHRHDDVRARLTHEAREAGSDPDVLGKLPYASAVVDETMRIVPIVTDVPRVTKQTFELEPGLLVPPGVVIDVLIEAIHLDPALYPEPKRFRPERFLERRYGPHEFLPFGGGNRRCLGAAFSAYEANIFLATLLQDVELERASRRLPKRVRRNVTMGPDDGVPMRVVRRHG